MNYSKKIIFFSMLWVAAWLLTAACSSSSSSDSGSSGGSGSGGGGGTSTAACTSPSWVSPWPMFHGFENHLGLDDAVGPQAAGTPQTFNANPTNLQGKQPNSVAIASDGTIYLAGGDKIYSINSTTLTENWSQSYTASQGPALSVDGTIYMATAPGGSSLPRIYAIDPTTHAAKTGWPFTAGVANVGLPSFPVVDSAGTIYFGTDSDHVFAVNSSGTQVFDYTLGGAAAEAAPALVDGVLYISSNDGKLYVIGQ